MNLDKLKDLEAKATPGELYLSETVEGNIYVYSKRHGRRYPETIPEKELVAALRNNAKEIFSTIERYKTALEDAKKILFTCSGSQVEEAITGCFNIMDQALKEPEKTDILKSSRP